jgi:Ca-activated chloride channel homolog
MTRSPTALGITCAVLIGLLDTSRSSAQVGRALDHPLAANIIVPQAMRSSMPHAARLQITQVTVGVVIVEQVATTTMDIELRNDSGWRTEAELVVPVPDGAVVRSFAFQGPAAEPTARILPADEARRTYDAIVAKLRDPALLEFLGYNLIRSSVFPVEANGTQKARLTYEHVLPAEGDRIDYLLPRSEALDYDVPWTVTVRIESKRPITTLYSPTHALETVQRNENCVSARLAGDAPMDPGAFRLSYLLEHEGVTASLMAYPDPGEGGGYFLLLGGLPASLTEKQGEPGIKREVTLVLDRSGSMSGEKIEQVRKAALQIIAGLGEGEAFRIITYNDAIEAFHAEPVLKDAAHAQSAREYLGRITAQGGTNIHDALAAALRPAPLAGMLPIVLFLTDGLPTVGQTSEVAIRDVALKANPHGRRIFTFGVGVDVNAPLLDKIAQETRATSTYVLPAEDVEVKVGQVFRRLTGPVLADARLELDSEGSAPRVYDMVPAVIPDLFDGSQLIVLGKYVGSEPLHFRLSGNYRGQRRTFQYTFSLDHATRKNAFVPRLWASRKIAVLVDAIRQLGANGGPAAHHDAAVADPRLKELVDEVVRLSSRFGILTEYTAFLAREGTDLSKRDEVLAEANRNFVARAMNTRSGMGAVNQSANGGYMMGQSQLNGSNRIWDENMNRVAIANVQQINDLAFYQRNGRWVDSRLVHEENTAQPRRVIKFGSDEFLELARRLAREDRQGSIAFRGDVLMTVDGEPVLIQGPGAGSSTH